MRRLAMLCALAGCIDGELATTEQAIVGGAPTTGNPEVALLVAFDANKEVVLICSSTLVGPRLLLTAAHCVDGAVPAPGGYGAYFGTNATVDPDPGFVFGTPADGVAVHPNWNRAMPNAGNDIAVVHLAKPVPITPRRVRTAPLTAADKGKPIELVGWGITGGGQSDSGVKRRVISKLFDFDAMLVLVGNGQTNICNGDSGGPAFLDGEVVGVSSFGDQQCTMAGVDTRVDAFTEWLASKGVEVAPTPPAPPPPEDDPVEEWQPRDDDGGCSTTRSSSLVLALAALFLARRRR